MLRSPTESEKTLIWPFLEPFDSSIGTSVPRVSTEEFPLPMRNSILFIEIVAAFWHASFYSFSNFGARKNHVNSRSLGLVDSCRRQSIQLLSTCFLAI